MSAPPDRSELARELAAARELTDKLGAVLDGALNRLCTAVERPVQATAGDSLVGTRPGDWRARGRRGRPSLLDTDARLNAFVRARIHDMPYEALAQEIAARFPAELHVSRSALHRWWKRERRRQEASG